MAEILYSGRIFRISADVDIERLADVILNSYAEGLHSWITLPLTGGGQNYLRLLLGPGIAVAIVGDEPKEIW